ncbi:hypothetical protein ACJIZ3_025117 [Penstemon smallii]|uniref:Thioredoxin domain-containing protein n=1 Tax=Penstemon smallii TaxID=265156 RepID=A0ABD3TVE6_9LAMI
MEMIMPIASTSTPKVPYCSKFPPVRAVTFSTARSCSARPSVAFNRVWLKTTPLRRSRKSSLLTMIKCGAVREINESEFADVVLKSERPVLVEFVATWCGPCRLIAPAVQSLAQEYEEKLTVVKVDHDSNPQLIEEYKVYGLPALIFFRNGKEVPESRREGAITKAKLKEYVDKLLESVSTV